VADKSGLKIYFDNGEHWKKMSYIDTLNFIYGYQLFTEQKIKIVPADLLLPEKELNTIINNLYKYFHAILGYIPECKKDYKSWNDELCCGFDVYGNSELYLVKQFN
jgi:hypothetical protein